MKLSELSLKRPPRKIWVSTGFGEGHYKYVEPMMLDDCSVVHLCESRDGLKQWYEKVVQPSLEKMGLQREEKSGRIKVLQCRQTK